MAIPSSSSQPGLPEIWLELQALRLEVAALRQSLERRPAAAAEPELAAGARVDAAADPPHRQASTATLLSRRNGERLQQEVRRRLALTASQVEHTPEDAADTEVDLLIDRLHELADAASPGP